METPPRGCARAVANGFGAMGVKLGEVVSVGCIADVVSLCSVATGNRGRGRREKAVAICVVAYGLDWTHMDMPDTCSF